MSGSKLQTALNDFVQIVVGIAEETASDTLEARAKALRTVSHPNRKPMSAKASTTKTRSMSKPCPVLNCENIGAPRHGMMCSDHSKMDKAAKAALRFAAKEFGGKWNPDPAAKKAAKKVKPKAKPKAKAKRKPKAKAKRKTA